MRHAPLAPLGAELTDVALDALAEEEVDDLRRLLAEHGVLAIPGQTLDDASFDGFLRRLGPPAFTTGETPLPGHPNLNPVSNVGRASPPKSSWHVDTSYVAEPPAYTALRAVAIPRAGGETLFSDQYAAAVTLPAELRALIAGRTMTHSVTGVTLAPGDEARAEHPLLRPHPLTDRAALYLTASARCTAISGLSAEATRETVDALLAHSTREANVLRHAWAPGDVVIWDNGCVMHRADHSGVVGDRVLHRGMVASYGAR